ncbi:MAG: hypothetical protein AAGA30_02325, partial [Planctomycetota bacterium]
AAGARELDEDESSNAAAATRVNSELWDSPDLVDHRIELDWRTRCELTDLPFSNRLDCCVEVIDRFSDSRFLCLRLDESEATRIGLGSPPFTRSMF